MSPRSGGRPRQIQKADIIRQGRALGLQNLSMSAVASALNVSTTALYRHVESRWDLERLVGEDILSELDLKENPQHDVAQHLLSMCLQLRTFTLEHPGLARYVQTLFPRGEGGLSLLASQSEALQRRGYAEDAAIVLCTAAASMLFGFVAAEEAQQERAEGIETQRVRMDQDMNANPVLSQGHNALPHPSAREYVRMWMGAAIQGFVYCAPPGRPVEDIRAALHAAVEGV